jgi:hypothetical protein
MMYFSARISSSAVTKSRATLCLLAGLAAPGALAANGHYAPGVEGIKGASVPPPGSYYRGYLVHYDIQALNDQQGDSLPGSNTGTVTVLANRFVHISERCLLGADYGVELIVPLQRTSLDFGVAGIDSAERGIGDIFVGPVVLGWHGSRWDAVFAAGLWLDTGDYSSREPASIGKGFNTTMLTLGGTYYPDAAKAWSLSALSRYEIKNRQEETGITPGDSWLVEWGLGKRLDNGIELGLIGYSAWQLEQDKGAGASPDKAERHALGLELGYGWPSLGLGLNAAYLNEYDVENGPEGQMLRLTVTKKF